MLGVFFRTGSATVEDRLFDPDCKKKILAKLVDTYEDLARYWLGDRKKQAEDIITENAARCATRLAHFAQIRQQRPTL